VDPVTSSVTISRPPGEVFQYLLDIANLPEWAGSYGEDWRLTREDTLGVGAGIRFKLRQRFNRFPWHDLAIIEAAEGAHVVLAGRAGKFNRIRALLIIDVDPLDGGRSSRVSLSYERQPKMLSDRLLERRGFHRRGWSRALGRLRDVLEGERAPAPRATIAGGPRKPATGSVLR
jgi:uncharacterized protein YndB with AHSA1/START domain